MTQRRQEPRGRTRGSRRREWIWLKYGISLEQVELTLAGQGGACAICRVPLAMDEGNVDHCHETGVVRGVLCRPCNLGLGFFRDNEDSLKKAARYVRTHRAA